MRPSAVTLSNLRLMLKRFAADTAAATAIEYAIIAAGVAVAIASVVFTTGSALQTNYYDKIGNALNSQ